MKDKIECVRDLARAKDLWHEFFTVDTLNDRWDFRYCFYKYFKYELFFYVGYSGGTPVALMPLQYNSDEEYLEFFGDCYIEDNRVFTKEGYERFIPELYKNLKGPAQLTDIVGADSFTTSLEIGDYKYTLPLIGLKNYQDYVDKYFQGKSKKNLKREMRIVVKNDIKILTNNLADLDLMVDRSIANFGEDSYFAADHSREIFHDIVNLPLDKQLLTFVVNGERQAVSLAILYKGSYIYITSASNNADIPNLGKYVNLINIQKAIDLGAKLFDAGVTHSNWKERWQFDKTPEYKFIRS